MRFRLKWLGAGPVYAFRVAAEGYPLVWARGIV